MKVIKNLFPKHSVESLKEASTRAIGIFSKTIQELNEINSQIQKQKSIKLTQINELQSECSSLQVQEEYNAKIVEKIETIIK
jgi:hypothetical protein